MLQQTEFSPFLFHRVAVCGGDHGNIRKGMGRRKAFLGTVVGNLQCFIQFHDGCVNCLGPAERLLEHQLGIGIRCIRSCLCNSIIAQCRCRICPVLQSFNTGNGLILFVDLPQRHGEALEAVDATGHRKQVDHIPAVENFILPCFQSPLGDHARTKAMEMLAVHGIHDTAVGIDAHQIIVFSFKRIKNRHYGSSAYIWVSHMPQ